MKINNNSFVLIPSQGEESLSLAATINQKLELLDFISRLSFCQPEDASSLEYLAQKLSNTSTSESTTSTSHLILNLILRQFPRPELDSVREVISSKEEASPIKENMSPPLDYASMNPEYLSFMTLSAFC